MAISTDLRILIGEDLNDRLAMFAADAETGCVDPTDEPTAGDVLDALFDAACTGRAHVNSRGYHLTRKITGELRELMIVLGIAVPYCSDSAALCSKADRLLFTHNGQQYEFGENPTPERIAEVL